LGGTISDWLLHRTGSRWIGRQLFAAACMVLSATFILVGSQTADTRLAICIMAAGSFCAAMGGPCAYAIPMEMGGKHVAAVFSTMNAVGSAGAFAFTSIVPWIKESGWNAVMFTFAGIYLAVACFWLLFDSRGTIVPARADE